MAKPDVKWIGSRLFTRDFFQPLVDRKILTREGTGNFQYKDGITEDEYKFVMELRERLDTTLPESEKIRIAPELKAFMYAMNGKAQWDRENRGRSVDVIRALRDKIYEVTKELRPDQETAEQDAEAKAGMGGRTYKKGGLLRKGERSVAVPIIAHSGELVVPVDTVDDVLNSNAWKKHVKRIANKKKVSISEAYKMSLGL